MGQKVHPYGFRLGIHTDWKSRWFSEKEYKAYLEADLRIREYLLGQLPHAGISRIDIERTRDRVRPLPRVQRQGIEPREFGFGHEVLPACAQPAHRAPQHKASAGAVQRAAGPAREGPSVGLPTYPF